MAEELLLVVEDNDVLREGLSDMLSYEGFKVMVARNGQEALERLFESLPELIVSDITMPVMDGYEFYRVVRSHDEWVSIPFVFLTARADQADVMKGKLLGVDDYLTKPLNREELVTAIRSRISRSRQLRVAQLQQAYVASLTALANAVDLRNRFSVSHVERVAAYALTLARHMGWSPRALEILHYAAILHDIGKLHISDAILFKKGPLSQQEWAQIRQHPVTGAEMVRNVPFLAGTAPFIQHHHEQWNGQGYPDGLAGEDIPLGARIIAVADTLETMTSERPYANACSLEQAYQEILNLGGKRYDPKVALVLQRAWQMSQIQAIAG